MFRKIIVVIAACFFIVGFLGFAAAADKGTAKDAQELVKKAIAYYKAKGKEKAFAAFNDTKGQFVSRDLYIFVFDLNGTCLSHGANAQLIGKNLIELKDSDGKLFIKVMMDGAKAKRTGWVDYNWTNPVSKKIEPKSTYYVKEGDVVFGCGIYK